MRTEGYYFVDKTRFIETIESFPSKYLTFLRPRKFGKSLLVSMLEYYYDLKHADKFERLFKGTYIYDHPTRERNSYHILSLDFSEIKVSSDISETEREFQLYITEKFLQFLRRYKISVNYSYDYLTKLSANMVLEKLVGFRDDYKLKIYLLIDEYDNFLNEVLINYGETDYMSITHGDGFIRSFFKKVKALTKSGTIDRVFITGVSPMAMNDVTSGYNIGKNISVHPVFSEMVGISESELERVLDYFVSAEDDILQIKEDLLRWYNGYSFNMSAPERRLYNTTLVWYYLDSYLQLGELPQDKLDSNLMTDFGKLKYLVYMDNRLNGNFSVLREVLETKETVGRFIDSFSIGMHIGKEEFRSLLYYLGLLSFKEMDIEGVVFRIPNYLTELMLWSYIRESIKLVAEDLAIDTDVLIRGFRSMAKRGEWREVFEYILGKFYEVVSVRDFIFKEEGVKMFFLAYLTLSRSYIVRSESVQGSGFADIYLEPRFSEVKYRYLIEFKYVNSKELEAGKEAVIVIDRVKRRAMDQLKRYSEKLSGTEYKCIVIIAGSKELLYMGEVGAGEA